jgi:hypothetical protein
VASALRGKLTFAVRENLCHAFFVGRTAKRYFVVRFIWNAQQRKKARYKILCHAFFPVRMANYFFPTSVTPFRTKGGGAIFSPFVVRLKKHTTKRILCRGFLF